MAVATTLFDLSGKAALLTGASRGIGLAMAGALAEHGAQVLVSSRKAENCAAACEAINSRCGRAVATPFACNVGDKEQLAALVDAGRRRFGRIDILVANAGVNPFYGPLAAIPDSAFDKILHTNIRANHWLCQMVAPDMAAAGGGSIILTASTAALEAAPGLGAYGISKLADIALVRSLALEYGAQGVRVNAICPGIIKTDFSRALWSDSDTRRDAEARTPLGRLGEAGDLEGIAVFLASGASGYVTGQAIAVCGGTHMWS